MQIYIKFSEPYLFKMYCTQGLVFYDYVYLIFWNTCVWACICKSTVVQWERKRWKEYVSALLLCKSNKATNILLALSEFAHLGRWTETLQSVVSWLSIDSWDPCMSLGREVVCSFSWSHRILLLLYPLPCIWVVSSLFFFLKNSFECCGRDHTYMLVCWFVGTELLAYLACKYANIPH